MREVTVAADFSKRLKEKIKPLHGVNNSPVSLYEPPPGFKEAGIPFCRLHDTAGPYGGSHYVDIPNVFTVPSIPGISPDGRQAPPSLLRP